MLTWEAKWIHIGLTFQTGVKTSSVHMKFHFCCISKRPHILMSMCRHFISGSVYMIFYHPKWNFISVKMTYMKSIPAKNFKRTCALDTISTESALIHFVLGKFCSHEISCRLKFHFGQNDRYEIHTILSFISPQNKEPFSLRNKLLKFNYFALKIKGLDGKTLMIFCKFLPVI